MRRRRASRRAVGSRTHTEAVIAFCIDDNSSSVLRNDEVSIMFAYVHSFIAKRRRWERAGPAPVGKIEKFRLT